MVAWQVGRPDFRNPQAARECAGRAEGMGIVFLFCWTAGWPGHHAYGFPTMHLGPPPHVFENTIQYESTYFLSRMPPGDRGVGSLCPEWVAPTIIIQCGVCTIEFLSTCTHMLSGHGFLWHRHRNVCVSIQYTSVPAYSMKFVLTS